MDSSIFVTHSHVILRRYQALYFQAKQGIPLCYAFAIPLRKSIYVNQAPVQKLFGGAIHERRGARLRAGKRKALVKG